MRRRGSLAHLMLGLPQALAAPGQLPRPADQLPAQDSRFRRQQSPADATHPRERMTGFATIIASKTQTLSPSMVLRTAGLASTLHVVVNADWSLGDVANPAQAIRHAQFEG